jgi:hypothetical protein
MIEVGGRCSGDGTSCTWSASKIIIASGISSDSGLAAVHYLDPGNQIRTFHQDVYGQMSGGSYSRGKWTVSDPFLQILPGTAIAATIDAIERPFITRVWHRDPQGNLREIHWNSRDEN